MASPQIDETSLVYSYLLKKSPKCAEIFSKTNKVKRLPPGSPALEDIIKNAISNTAVSNKGQSPKTGTLSNVRISKDSSSDSSSDTEDNSSKPNLPVKGTPNRPVNASQSKKKSSSSDSDSSSDTKSKPLFQTPIKKSIVTNKRDESSSDSSDSEDEKPKSNIPLKVTPLSKQKPISKEESSSSDSDSDAPPPKTSVPNVKVQQSQKAKDSSSSDDSDSEPNKVANSNKFVVGKQLPKTPQTHILTKKDDSSDDSSSDSDNETKKSKSLSNKSNPVAKIAKESSDSESESEDEKGVVVSLAKKISAQFSKQVSSPSISKNSLPVSKLGLVSKNDTSDDSSSESEDEPQKKFLGKQLSNSIVKSSPVNTISNYPASSKPNLKSKSSSSDDSSDSCGKTTKVQSSAKKTPQCIKKPIHEVSSSEDSDDSSDDSSDASAAKTQFPISKGNQVAVSSPKKPVMSSTNTVVSPKKPVVSSLKTKEASDSSSDSSDEDTKTLQQKSMGKVPISKSGNTPLQKIRQADTSSSSESEDEPIKNKLLKPPTVLSSKVKQTADSSSDTSSDEEDNKPVSVKANQVKMSAKSTIITQKNNKKDSSSSSSDSEDEKPQSNITAVSNKSLLTKSPKLSGVPSKKESSSDSSSEDEKPVKKVPSNQLNFQSIVSTSQNIVNKMKNNKPDSSSSSSSSSGDEAPIKKASTAVPKILASKPTPSLKTSNKQSSSDSSDSDDETPTTNNATTKLTTLKPTPNSRSRGESSSSDSSDSEDNAENKLVQKQGKTSNVNSNQKATKRPANSVINSSVSPKKTAVQMQQNDSSSDDSSSSEDENTPKTKFSVAVKPSVLTSKKASSSSSSDSESEQVTNKMPILNQVQNSKVSKRKKSSSSSSEESEEESARKKPFTDSQSPKGQTGWEPAATNHNQSQHNDQTPVTSDSTKQRRGSSPFRRVKSENFVVDYRMKQSAEIAKQSLPSFQGVRGKQFRHEKTKKKRMSAFGGRVDTSVKSIKFDD